MNPKIALCLSGHLRDGDKTSFPALKTFIIDKYDCDIFVSSWDVNAFNNDHFNFHPKYSETQSETGVVDRIISTYKPKKYNIESGKPDWLVQIEDKWKDQRLATGMFGSPYASSMLAMFKKMEDADTLRTTYQEETGTKYDLVIRFRFDAAPAHDFIEENKNFWYNKKNIVFKQFYDFGFVDILFFGDEENMKLASRSYSANILNSENVSRLNNGEHVLRTHIENNKIPFIISNNMSFFGNFRPESMQNKW
jgi:hypothetical protein